MIIIRNSGKNASVPFSLFQWDIKGLHNLNLIFATNSDFLSNPMLLTLKILN